MDWVRLLTAAMSALHIMAFDYWHRTAWRRCGRKVWECKEWMCAEYDRCDCAYRYRDVL